MTNEEQKAADLLNRKGYTVIKPMSWSRVLEILTTILEDYDGEFDTTPEEKITIGRVKDLIRHKVEDEERQIPYG